MMKATSMFCLVVLFVVFITACDPGFPEPKPHCDVPPELSMAGDMGITHYLDLDRGRECAASTNRKLLVMFTGLACVAVDGQEWRILRADRIRKLIDEQYVLVVLYGDDKDSLPMPINTHRYDGIADTLFTYGQKNAWLEETWCRQNSQPLYVTLDTNLTLIESMGYSKDSVAFEDMLRRTIE